jgi:hypothetical protein
MIKQQLLEPRLVVGGLALVGDVDGLQAVTERSLRISNGR